MVADDGAPTHSTDRYASRGRPYSQPAPLSAPRRLPPTSYSVASVLDRTDVVCAGSTTASDTEDPPAEWEAKDLREHAGHVERPTGGHEDDR